MKKCEKPELNDQLLAYLENELDYSLKKEVEKHLKHCSYCQQELRNFQQLRETVKKALSCPAAEKIAQREDLSVFLQKEVNEHLIFCPSCKEEQAILQQLERDVLTEDTPQEKVKLPAYLRTLIRKRYPKKGFFATILEFFQVNFRLTLANSFVFALVFIVFGFYQANSLIALFPNPINLSSEDRAALISYFDQNKIHYKLDRHGNFQVPAAQKDQLLINLAALDLPSPNSKVISLLKPEEKEKELLQLLKQVRGIKQVKIADKEKENKLFEVSRLDESRAARNLFIILENKKTVNYRQAYGINRLTSLYLGEQNITIFDSKGKVLFGPETYRNTAQNINYKKYAFADTEPNFQSSPKPAGQIQKTQHTSQKEEVSPPPAPQVPIPLPAKKALPSFAKDKDIEYYKGDKEKEPKVQRRYHTAKAKVRFTPEQDNLSNKVGTTSPSPTFSLRSEKTNVSLMPALAYQHRVSARELSCYWPFLAGGLFIIMFIFILLNRRRNRV